MKRLFFLSLLLYLCSADTSLAQQVILHQLTCRGNFMGEPAELVGKQAYRPYNTLGDGTVQFSGTLRTPSGAATLTYEGYTNPAPYEGRLHIPSGPYQGVYPVSILDATGNYNEQFIIYEGRASLGPPNEWGRLVCTWTRVDS